MSCRKMTQTDLDAVVAIHQRAFKGFFLTRMGPRFIRAYYQAVLDFEASIALLDCGTAPNEILGFAVGFRDPQGFYALFSSRRKRLVGAILVAVLRDPALVMEIYRNTRRIQTQAQTAVDSVELSSIAVAVPNRGVGSALLDEFVSAARQGGAQHLALTTDSVGNDDVRKFYEARGFTLKGVEDRGDRRLLHYQRALG